MTGLRTHAGINLNHLRQVYQFSFTPAQLHLIDRWQQLGYVEWHSESLRLTRTGWLLADRLAAELFVEPR
jgi:coproporphyrinogen III oxidase-like Fe-S oxidoreductase